MSLQVGSFCFASQLDAATAACSAFTTLHYSDRFVLQSTSCTGVTPAGALMLQVSSTNIRNGITSVANYTQLEAYPPCNESSYIAAAETIFGAVLVLWMLIYTGRKLVNFADWSRGSND